jgi:hypothetical protein
MNSIPIQVIEPSNRSYSLAKFLLNELYKFLAFGVRIDYIEDSAEEYFYRTKILKLTGCILSHGRSDK